HRRNIGEPQKVIRRLPVSFQHLVEHPHIGFSIDDSSASRRSSSTERRCHARSIQWPESNFCLNRHFICISWINQ
ncbi:hypothetical protein HAX54_011564, partial [Datura stramonium]|nr:hypothetical protein [Datura stramonium]